MDLRLTLIGLRILWRKVKIYLGVRMRKEGSGKERENVEESEIKGGI